MAEGMEAQKWTSSWKQCRNVSYSVPDKRNQGVATDLYDFRDQLEPHEQRLFLTELNDHLQRSTG